jgi:hypothetical protein
VNFRCGLPVQPCFLLLAAYVWVTKPWYPVVQVKIAATVLGCSSPHIQNMVKYSKITPHMAKYCKILKKYSKITPDMVKHIVKYIVKYSKITPHIVKICKHKVK